MDYIKTRTIMTKCEHGARYFGIDYHMNLYKGCTFGCIYCNSRSDIYHIKNFDEIQSKENALKILEEELSCKKYKGVVSLGALSDPYNPLEEQYEITRNALKLIEKYGFGVSIDTKSDLILRDIDLLKSIAKNNNVIVKISITTFNEELSSFLEPNVITPRKRFEVVKTLSENGIYVGVLMTPVLPFITDTKENIKEMVLNAHKYKAKFIYTNMSLILRKTVKDYYFENLDKMYKGLSTDYKVVFENHKICHPLKYPDLLKLFVDLCNKYNILCDMNEIINDYKKKFPNKEQISLF